MRQAFLILFVIATVLSCESTSSKRNGVERSGQYLNLTALLDEQVGYLLEKKASLHKQVKTGYQTDTIQAFPLDSVEWKNQLALFYDADISLPGYDGAYFEEQLPGISGETKVIYTARTAKLKVRVLECTYIEKQLKTIRIEVAEKNTIYKFDKRLSLEFESVSGLLLLESFNMAGHEYMQFKQPLNYQIEAKVIYP